MVRRPKTYRQPNHIPFLSAGWSRLPGPHDSRDSGVYSAYDSSQDYGSEYSPQVESKALVFPGGMHGRPGACAGGGMGEQRPSVPLSQLVRKLSEVEGIMPNMPLHLATAAASLSSAAQQVGCGIRVMYIMLRRAFVFPKSRFWFGRKVV